MLIKLGIAGGTIGAIGAVFLSTPVSSGALFGIIGDLFFATGYSAICGCR